MIVAVIGSGYVGLVTGACLAKLGHTVTCYDNDEKKIASLKKGELPIYEPGLDNLILPPANQGSHYNISFISKLIPALFCATVIIIAVGTPSKQDGTVDLSYVERVAEEIAPFIDNWKYRVVAIKSTVPVGTSRRVREIIIRTNPRSLAYFDVVSNPEFLREGTAISDFLHPDRIVIGCPNESSKTVMEKLYQPLLVPGELSTGELVPTGVPLVSTDPETSELIKYAANGFLATKVAYINQISNLAERNGANVVDLARGIGLDKRIGEQFLKPGPGFGGSCFPKDALALVNMGIEHGERQTILETTIETNYNRKFEICDRIGWILGENESLKGFTIGILGLTFKANTDDIRDSPSLAIIEILLGCHATIKVYDPMMSKIQSNDSLARCTIGTSCYDVASDADLLVILTEWNEFAKLQLRIIKDVMRRPIILDCRNLYHPKFFTKSGVSYHSLGRGPVIE